MRLPIKTQRGQTKAAIDFAKQSNFMLVLGLKSESKDWHSATAVARAFQIGEKEAKSVCHLQTAIHKDIVVKLRESVRTRGMRQFLTHDLLAGEMFNLGWSSGKSGSLSPWQGELTNLENNQLVS